MKRLILLGIGSLVCLLSFSQSKEAEKTVQDTNVAQPTAPADSNPIDDDYIYTKVEKKAEFSGGNNEFYTFLRNNLNYPQEAMLENIQGTVIVTFVVEKDGSITDIKVTRPVNPLLDEEAVRLVKTMPKWTPAEKDGKVVRSYFSIPLCFSIK